MDPYTYEPLPHNDSIRVLELLPGQQGATLRARLLSLQLSQDPVFAALSYCWGEPKFEILLECNGRALLITPSLAAALNRLRDTTQSLVVWVDQVCINQSDIPERNMQVTLMGEIYKSAKEVQIWLGEEDASSIPGLRLVERLSKAREERDKNGDTRNRFQLGMVGFAEYNLPSQDDEAYPSFLSLLRRPWFRRGWILQEAVLAKASTFHCGSFSFGLAECHRALVFCCDLGFAEDEHTESVLSFMGVTNMRHALSKNRREELFTLLLQTRAAITTDYKDKVYCLLGLARNAEELDIKPDYSEDCNWADVFRDTAIRIIQTYGNLDVLSTPRLKDDLTLPSWVPDWRPTSTHILSLTSRERAETCKYRATGSSKASITFRDEERKVLGLSGYSIDQIVACGDVFHQEDPHKNKRSMLQSLREAYTFGLDLRLRYMDWKRIAGLYRPGPYITGSSKEDAFMQILIAGHTFASDTEFEKIKANYRAWNKIILRFSSWRAFLPHHVIVALILLQLTLTGLRTFLALMFFLPLYDRRHEPFNNLIQCVLQRRIIRTEKGYIGLAPEFAREGDSVALFEGGKLPFIVRRGRGENWIMVGDCYVHGMMDGEVFDGGKCERLWLE